MNKDKQINKESEDYKAGYEAGYEDCKQDFYNGLVNNIHKKCDELCNYEGCIAKQTLELGDK